MAKSTADKERASYMKEHGPARQSLGTGMVLTSVRRLIRSVLLGGAVTPAPMNAVCLAASSQNALVLGPCLKVLPTDCIT